MCVVVEVDWREQIYYWTGELSFDISERCFKWRGSWLGSFTGKPEPEDFAWNNNEFEYVSGKVEPLVDVLDPQGQLLPPSAAFFRGHYMMDATGSGRHDKYFDKQFFAEFKRAEATADADADADAEDSESKYVVIGKGDSEFGPFLLSGTYCVATKMLDMSRQYMDPNKQSNSMVQQELMQQPLPLPQAQAQPREGEQPQSPPADTAALRMHENSLRHQEEQQAPSGAGSGDV